MKLVKRTVEIHEGASIYDGATCSCVEGASEIRFEAYSISNSFFDSSKLVQLAEFQIE